MHNLKSLNDEKWCENYNEINEHKHAYEHNLFPQKQIIPNLDTDFREKVYEEKVENKILHKKRCKLPCVHIK